MLLDRRCRPLRVLQRSGADIHTLRASSQRTFKSRIITNSTGQFNIDGQLTRDFCHQLVVRTTPKCRIQVHEVQPLRALCLPLECRIQRRSVILLRTSFPLVKADRLAVDDIYCGQNSETHMRSLIQMTDPIL